MEFIIGKPKFKTTISYVCYTTFAVVSIVWVCKELQSPLFECGLAIFVIYAILTIMFVIPNLAYSKLMWKINDESIQYTYYETVIDKMRIFYKHILKNHKLEYQVNIKLNQIEHIGIVYSKSPRFPYGQYGYDIKFKVHMKDGTIFTFISLVTRDRKTFLKAIEFMKMKGINFIDKYHIQDELKKNRPIAVYLDELEKKHD